MGRRLQLASGCGGRGSRRWMGCPCRTAICLHGRGAPSREPAFVYWTHRDLLRNTYVRKRSSACMPTFSRSVPVLRSVEMLSLRWSVGSGYGGMPCRWWVRRSVILPASGPSATTPSRCLAHEYRASGRSRICDPASSATGCRTRPATGTAPPVIARPSPLSDL